MNWFTIVCGLLLVGVALVDIYLTTIAAAGGGGPVTRAIGRAGTAAARAFPLGDVHRRLMAAGHIILIAVVLGWLAMIWAGFVLLFVSDPMAVVDSGTQQPAGVVAKMAYAAGALAGAGAGFVANSGGWEAVNNLAAILGLSWAALTLTYLLQVVTAVSHGRALALRILGIGPDPTRIAAVGHGSPRLGWLGQNLVNVTQDIALMARYHEALPALRYFHTGQRLAAIEVAVAVLDEGLTILEASDSDAIRTARQTRLATAEFLRTVASRPSAPTPELPPHDALEEAGVRLPDGALQRRAEQLDERRRQLRTLIEQRGWDWHTDVLANTQR